MRAIKYKKVNQVKDYVEYDSECKCKICTKARKNDMKILKKLERTRLKRYINKEFKEVE